MNWRVCSELKVSGRYCEGGSKPYGLPSIQPYIWTTTPAVWKMALFWKWRPKEIPKPTARLKACFTVFSQWTPSSTRCTGIAALSSGAVRAFDFYGGCCDAFKGCLPGAELLGRPGSTWVEGKRAQLALGVSDINLSENSCTPEPESYRNSVILFLAESFRSSQLVLATCLWLSSQSSVCSSRSVGFGMRLLTSIKKSVDDEFQLSRIMPPPPTYIPLHLHRQANE